MIAHVFQKYPENFSFQLFIILHYLTLKFAIFLKCALLFNSFHCLFPFVKKTLRLNNFKTRTDMNAKTSVFVICIEAIIHLLLYNWHDCTFKVVSLISVTKSYNNQQKKLTTSSISRINKYDATKDP